ncbi:nuclear transport factor 2 family protein [Halpernia frigidisoli]|uniref:SnoaL-like domain-containing protein n=1 Tax=Halpernia frigidisoli TaxID=1125876 RepID=A0A1I3DRE7_9FLAO|nr:nuclear transport factor 2 family protein [Halpernia frigidisoli]SFH89320.1 SnoaL-like domain-containing protein [Halpernia frigidisoli]
MTKKTLLFFIIIFTSFGIKSFAQKEKLNEKIETKNIVEMLDGFNKAAGSADFKKYFDYYDADSYFMGTDATERWNKKEFMVWAKPFFDKGKAWNFTAIKRNIYFSPNGKMAWFDELLSTQMKICRGSGVLEKTKSGWKVKQYVLSITIPNSLSEDITILKAPIEDSLIEKLTK